MIGSEVTRGVIQVRLRKHKMPIDIDRFIHYNSVVINILRDWITVT
jgi:hypothetical protein